MFVMYFLLLMRGSVLDLLARRNPPDLNRLRVLLSRMLPVPRQQVPAALSFRVTALACTWATNRAITLMLPSQTMFKD